MARLLQRFRDWWPGKREEEPATVVEVKKVAVVKDQNQLAREAREKERHDQIVAMNRAWRQPLVDDSASFKNNYRRVYETPPTGTPSVKPPVRKNNGA